MSNRTPSNSDVIAAAKRDRPMPNNSGNDYLVRQEQQKLHEKFRPKDNKGK